MKIRLSTVVIYSAAILAGTALMYTSQLVQEAERELRNLQIGRDDARDNLHMMNAEWAYLTRPERLEQLAVQYLPGLAPMSPEQLRDDYNFPTPVLEELPTGPTLMPQEASAQMPLPSNPKTPAPVVPIVPEAVAETPVTAPVPAEDMALAPTLITPKAASPAVNPSAPQAQAITAAAIAPAAASPAALQGHPSEVSDFSQLLTRVTDNTDKPVPDAHGGAGGR